MPKGGTIPLWRQVRALRSEAMTEAQVVEIVERLLDERFGKKPKPDKK